MDRYGEHNESLRQRAMTEGEELRRKVEAEKQMRGMLSDGMMVAPSKPPAGERLLQAADDADAIANMVENLLADIVGATVQGEVSTDMHGQTLAAVIEEVPARTSAARTRATDMIEELRKILL